MRLEQKAKEKLEKMLLDLERDHDLAMDRQFVHKYVLTCYAFHKSGSHETYEKYIARLMEAYPIQLKGGQS